jgi:hypothetical protein
LAAAQSFLQHSRKFKFEQPPTEPEKPIKKIGLDPTICDEFLLGIGAIRESVWEVPQGMHGGNRKTYQMETWFLEEILNHQKPKGLSQADILMLVRSTVDEDRAIEILAAAGHKLLDWPDGYFVPAARRDYCIGAA